MKQKNDVAIDPIYGDLIWMECFPGGVCIFLSSRPALGRQVQHIVYTIHHPTEGIMEMPEYYFITTEEAQHLNAISTAEDFIK